MNTRVLVPLELTPAVRLFLLGALVSEARRWRVDGVKPPVELHGFIDWLSGVHEGSIVDVVGAMPSPDYVSREVAARRSGISVSTIKRAIGSGRLPERRIGRRSLIAVEDLVEFMAVKRVRRAS